VDYRTLGDNQMGSKKLDYPWQSPATVSHSWGYHATDTQWKSTSTLLRSLIGNVSLNGNFMLNIGPRGNGDVPFEISQRMLEMGEWLDVNGESIYGAEAFDLDKNQHDWGKITYKPKKDGKHLLYLHVYNWPYNHKLPVTGITSKPVKSYVLRDKQQAPLDFVHNKVFTEINLPYEQPDPYVSVIVLEYDLKPEIEDDLVAKTVDAGHALTPSNLYTEDGDRVAKEVDRRGTLPAHFVIDEEYQSKWKIYVDKPGKMNIDVSYSFQGEKPKGTISVSSVNSTLKHNVQPTGLTVGEPNRDYHLDNFVSNSLGSIDFPEKGIYEITLEIGAKKDTPINFQWLWVK
jgi:alpha-L-fucosidase